MNDAVQLNAAITRAIESSPAIVILLGLIGIFIWRAWREDRMAWMEALSEERDARVLSQREMAGAVNSCTLAVQAVREALIELRHAINDKQGPR